MCEQLGWDPSVTTAELAYVLLAVDYVVLGKSRPRMPRDFDTTHINRVLVQQLRTYADAYATRKPPEYEDRLDELCNLMTGE